MPKLIEHTIAKIGRTVAKKAVNSASWPYLYQPKEPNAVKDLYIKRKEKQW